MFNKNNFFLQKLDFLRGISLTIVKGLIVEFLGKIFEKD